MPGGYETGPSRTQLGRILRMASQSSETGCARFFRNNYRSLSDWRLFKIEQHVQNCTHDRGITPSAFESHVFVLSDSCCRRTLNTVPSWICQILDKGGRSNESIGKIPEVCRRMRGHGQIRAVPGEQSYVGPFGGEMDSVR